VVFIGLPSHTPEVSSYDLMADASGIDIWEQAALIVFNLRSQ